ncbi:MAG: hypothetical protein WAU86_18640 [Oricola sp.]
MFDVEDNRPWRREAAPQDFARDPAGATSPAERHRRARLARELRDAALAGTFAANDDMPAVEPPGHAPPRHGPASRSWRLRVLGISCAGLVLGLVVALSMPQRYTSHAQVVLDPGEFRLAGGALASGYVARETVQAIVDAKLDIVRSPAVLARVAERAKLDQDPEFNGEGGLLRPLRAYLSLFSTGDTVVQRDRSAIRALRENLSARRAPGDPGVDIAVTTGNARKSAFVANEIAKAFVEELASVKSGPAGFAPAARLGPPAEPSHAPSSTPREFVVAGFTAAGLALGILLAALSSLRGMASGQRPVPRPRYAPEAFPGPLHAPPAVDEGETASVRMATEHSPAVTLSYAPWPVVSGYAWPAPAIPANASQPQIFAASREDEEMEDLRHTVRELRDTVNALRRRRAERHRRVA